MDTDLAAFAKADDDFKAYVRSIFAKASFIRELGMQLEDLGPGWCETSLKVEEKHRQQDGFVHAGVVATMADHTAGGASGTLAPAGKIVLTVEYKINFLRPGLGERLRCRAQVLKPGKAIIVAESEVYGVQDSAEKLLAKATVTLAVVDGRVT